MNRLVYEMTLPINMKELKELEGQNRIKHQSAVEGLNKLMVSLQHVCGNNFKRWIEDKEKVYIRKRETNVNS